MKTLRILVSLHVHPNSVHPTTLLIKNLLPILSEKINVEINWLLYQPKKTDQKILDVNSKLWFLKDFMMQLRY